MSTEQNKTTRLPLREAELEAHVEQRILERLQLRHLYKIEWDEAKQEYVAIMKPRAVTAIWRVVQDAVGEAGWKIAR